MGLAGPYFEWVAALACACLIERVIELNLVEKASDDTTGRTLKNVSAQVDFWVGP
jgi:hypothetical protein